MAKYFYIWHVTHQYADGFDPEGKPYSETKEIGVYGSRRLAEQAVGRFRDLPGFRDRPEGFRIRKCRCILSGGAEQAAFPPAAVFRPYHEFFIPEENCDMVTRGRFYVYREEAEKELALWKEDPALQKHPDGFAVLEFRLNEDGRFWSEGFDRKY